MKGHPKLQLHRLPFPYNKMDYSKPKGSADSRLPQGAFRVFILQIHEIERFISHQYLGDNKKLVDCQGRLHPQK